MKHLILGTAGHVDHGKTALIKALTGTDCDTHPEERRRGITINLGFAHLDYPGGESIGIVDVPGHHDFVHTMVSGASSVDLALLVVAADSGVMPQTVEHLQIMEGLGVKAGLVALSKADLAEPQRRAESAAQVRALIEGTFLEGAPLVEVSSTSGEGLDALKQRILEVAAGTREKPRGYAFRLYVDRFFEAKGFGGVVTGSVISGALRVGQSAHLLPQRGRPLRVRTLQRHGCAVEEVTAGDRAAINLVGLERAQAGRGVMLSDRDLPTTSRLDARLRLFSGAGELEVWSRVLFYIGTHEGGARLHLLDRDKLHAGEAALVQIELETPQAIYYGDRFVLRDSSASRTLGGGVVIDACPLHHRRRPPDLVERLSRLAAGGLPEALSAEIRKRQAPMHEEALAEVFNVETSQVLESAAAGLGEDIIELKLDAHTSFILKAEYERLRRAALERLAACHRNNPFQAGVSAAELAAALQLDRSAELRSFLDLLISELEQERRIKRAAGAWALINHELNPDAAEQQGVAEILSQLKECGMQLPSMTDLKERARAAGIAEQSLRQMLRHLTETRQAYAVADTFVWAGLADACREKLLLALTERPAGISLAEFRDLIGGNRKLCVALFSLFESEGVVLRKGDLRIITEKGRARRGTPNL